MNNHRHTHIQDEKPKKQWRKVLKCNFLTNTDTYIFVGRLFYCYYTYTLYFKQNVEGVKKILNFPFLPYIQTFIHMDELVLKY